MKRHLFICLAAVCAAMAHANIAENITGPSDDGSNGPFTLGYDFTPTVNIIVTALGGYASPNAYSQDIGIWDVASGALLMEGSTDGSEIPVDYCDYTSGITSFTSSGLLLTAGTEYVVGAGGESAGQWSDGSYSMDPEIVNDGFVYVPGGFGEPTSSFGDSLFGGNFQFQNATTPGPEAILPFLGGLIALARRRRNRA